MTGHKVNRIFTKIRLSFIGKKVYVQIMDLRKVEIYHVFHYTHQWFFFFFRVCRLMKLTGLPQAVNSISIVLFARIKIIWDSESLLNINHMPCCSRGCFSVLAVTSQ
jgi:hypothetical protein